MRAQASVEIVMAVALIIMLFLMVLWFVNAREGDVQFVEQQYDNQRACGKLSSIISSAYAARSGTVLTATIDRDAKIIGNNIHIGKESNYSCTFVGSAQENLELKAGGIKARNVGGTVIVENLGE
ncbi:MAG: hypothetical protein ABH854_05565 [Candidatus Diapherotrites archaeon]|nr:hypothetical protein [Candidatus Micrarchaeota archaeon]MBU1940074.1 hypothetical protein [Candidatus Micrarchaeota archaeon]